MNLQYRKYTLSLLVILSAVIGLFTGKVDQGGFITLATLVLSIYGAANVADKKMGGQG